MIIRRLNLHPFAGVSNSNFEFQPGINVVFGPNEAGKSTLVNALRTVLLEPTDYRKKKWDDELLRFVPNGGGDTFRVTLEFEQLGAPHKVSKQWGSLKRSEMQLPNGQLISSSADVEIRLAELLSLKQGTWDNVLFAHQNHLSETLAHLAGDGPEKTDLAGILRSAVMATDGISLEKLDQSIELNLSNLRSRWDEQMQRPESNRGIQNPWKQGVGSILAAWYRKENARSTLSTIDRYEHDLDRIVTQLSERLKQRDLLQAYIDQWGPIAKAAGERQGIEAQLQLAKSREDSLKKIGLEWPQFDERKNNKAAEATQLKATVENLQTEFKNAEKHLKQQSQRDKLNRANSILKEIDAAKLLSGAILPLSRLQFKELETLARTEEKLLTSLEAGELTVRIVIHGASQFEVQRGPEPKESIAKSTDFAANGRVTIENSDFQIEVTSGQIDFNELQSQLQEARISLSKKLGQFDLASLEDARVRCEESEKRTNEVRGLESILSKELGSNSIEELEKEIDSSLATPSRDLQTIQSHLSGEQNKLNQLTSDVAQLEQKIKEWTTEFETHDGLQDKLLDAREERKKQEKLLTALPELPSELDSVEEFLAQFAKKDTELRSLKETTIPELKEQKANLGIGPELSRMEAEEELKSAELEFENQISRLRSLTRVKSVFGKLKSALDGGTLDPWLSSLKSILQPLTSGHYVDIDTDTGEVSRGPSTTLSYDLLSMGTKSCLGIALRLSMARHFLDGNDGFLVLDDPMVDLDLDRQKQTVELLKDFAHTCQIIVVTCHPAHAELLGGKRIDLPRLY